MSTLIEKLGGDAFVSPSMQEVPVEANSLAAASVAELIAGKFGTVVFLTGVGASALLDVAESQNVREDFLTALRKTSVCVRGPKPAAVLKQWNVPIAVRAPEPNTWKDLVAAMDAAGLNLSGQNVAIQEYGVENAELADALAARGAETTSVSVYRWELPNDIRPLESAVRGIADGQFDILLITSAQQIRHAIEVAGRLEVGDQFAAGLTRTLVGSIGPTATETLSELGIRVDLEPGHPKMGPLVREAIEAWTRRGA